MAKSRRPSPRKRAKSSSRRKTATSRSKRGTSKTKSRTSTRAAFGMATSGSIELKPIRAEIGRVIEALRGLPQTDRTKNTLERLQRMSADFDDICDPENPFGCGPDMAFPTP
ncbi:MAG TPA: hypothetical protein VFK57_01800 [Vicinamibacterales bacterium]|nr:hypothetical protein [Vicinamibacterales bacterium]